jgi:hypothetical protein
MAKLYKRCFCIVKSFTLSNKVNRLGESPKAIFLCVKFVQAGISCKSLPSIVKGFVISNKVDRLGEQDYHFLIFNLSWRDAKRRRANICLTWNAYIGALLAERSDCKKCDNSILRLKQLLGDFFIVKSHRFLRHVFF